MFHNIPVQPESMFNVYAKQLGSLPEGIGQFAGSLAEGIMRYQKQNAEADALHNFATQGYVGMMKNATGKNAEFAKSLASVGIAQSQLEMEQKKNNLIMQQMQNENELYGKHGWDLVGGLAAAIGKVEVDNPTAGHVETDEATGTSTWVPGTPGKTTLYDATQQLKDIQERFKDVPLTKTAVGEISDVLQRGYAGAISRANRLEIEQGKTPQVPPEVKTVQDYNKFMLKEAAKRGFNPDQLDTDEQGRLMLPSGAPQGKGWDVFGQEDKLTLEAKRAEDRSKLATQYITAANNRFEKQQIANTTARALMMDYHREQLALQKARDDASDASSKTRITELKRKNREGYYKNFYDIIQTDMRDQTDKYGDIIPGTSAGKAYWRALGSLDFTPDEIGEYLSYYPDENAVMTYVIRNLNPDKTDAQLEASDITPDKVNPLIDKIKNVMINGKPISDTIQSLKDTNKFYTKLQKFFNEVKGKD